MRRLYWSIVAFASSILSSAIPLFPAHATSLPQQKVEAAPAPSGIETDPKTGAVLFIVNGREQARIDATGLHVRESVDYAGTLTDGSTIYPPDPPAPKGNGKP